MTNAWQISVKAYPKPKARKMRFTASIKQEHSWLLQADADFRYVSSDMIKDLGAFKAWYLSRFIQQYRYRGYDSHENIQKVYQNLNGRGESKEEFSLTHRCYVPWVSTRRRKVPSRCKEAIRHQMYESNNRSCLKETEIQYLIHLCDVFKRIIRSR